MKFFSRRVRPQSVQLNLLQQKNFGFAQNNLVNLIFSNSCLFFCKWGSPGTLLVISFEIVVCALLFYSVNGALYHPVQNSINPTYLPSLKQNPRFVLTNQVSDGNGKNIEQRFPSPLNHTHTSTLGNKEEPSSDSKIFSWIGLSNVWDSSTNFIPITKALFKLIKGNASSEIYSPTVDRSSNASLLTLRRLADEKNFTTPITLAFSSLPASSVETKYSKLFAANRFPLSLSRFEEDSELAKSLNSVVAVSDAVFFPISYLDVLNGNWLNSLAYRTLLFVLNFHMRCVIRNIASLSVKERLKYLAKADTFALAGAYAQPKTICFTIVLPSNKENLASSFELSDQEKKEITLFLKQTISQMLETNFRAISNIENFYDSYFRRVGDIFNIQVSFLNQIPDENDIKALFKNVCNDIEKQTSKRIAKNANKIVKRFDHLMQAFLRTTKLSRVTSMENLNNTGHLEELEELEKTKYSIFKRCRNTMIAYPSSFHLGLDTEFGTSCDEIIDNAMAVFDEETRALQGSIYWHKKRKELLQFLLMDLHPKFDLQVQKLRMLSLQQFRNALNDLPLDTNIGRSLSDLIRNTDRFFATNCGKLKPKTAVYEWDESFARSDLQYSMREIANTIIEFARLNGVYKLEKKWRMPIGISFHYLSPNAFGLSDYSRQLLIDSDKVSYDHRTGTLLSSVDPRLEKKDNVLIPYDIPIDLKTLSDSMVYSPDKK